MVDSLIRLNCNILITQFSAIKNKLLFRRIKVNYVFSSCSKYLPSRDTCIFVVAVIGVSIIIKIFLKILNDWGFLALRVYYNLNTGVEFAYNIFNKA